MELKDIIRNARNKKGLTQRALAGLMNVTYQNIQLWERGKYKPNMSNTFKLCKILDIDIEDIISPQNEVTTDFNISKPK